MSNRIKVNWVLPDKKNSKSSYFYDILREELEQDFEIKPSTKLSDLDNKLSIINIEDHAKVKDFIGQIKGNGLHTIIHDVFLSHFPEIEHSKHANNFSKTICLNKRNLIEYQKQTNKTITLLGYPTALAEEAKKAPEKVTRIAYSGEMKLEYRYEQFLNALSKLEINYELNWLINPEELQPVESVLNKFSVRNYKLLTERSVEEWSKLQKDSHISVHTLFSAYGDASPFLEISLAHGTPSIVTDFSSTADIPDEVVMKITPGFDEDDQILNYLNQLSSNKDFYRKRSALSLDYAKEFQNVKVIAKELKESLMLSNSI